MKKKFVCLCLRHIDDAQTNGTTNANGNVKSTECVGSNADESQENESSILAAYSKRPVSMYETREGPHASKSQQTHDNRTANSMYQMGDGVQAPHTDSASTSSATNGSTLPHSDDVKHRTEMVTRRIQELWSVMQEMTSNDVFVPGAERIRMAVSELTAIFPEV